MGRPRYPVLVCVLEPTKCPHDNAFQHDPYFGCVPLDFNERTGRSKTHKQTRRTHPEFGHRYYWNGGCAARELAAVSRSTGEET